MRVGSPVATSIAPVIFSVASSMTNTLLGQPPMYSVPLPPTSFAGAAANEAAAAAATAAAINRFIIGSSRKDKIEFAPVLLRRRALRRPVGRVIELVGHVRRPEAPDVAVEDVALDGLTQAGRAAGLIRRPSGGEHERAPEREVRLRRLLGGLLQRDHGLLGVRA